MAYIYKITNKINGKSYIGQTVSKVSIRFNQHVNYAKRAKQTGKRLFYLSKAILKYGKECFTIEVLEEVSNTELLNEREIYWIDFYDTFNHGYNLNKGGQFRAKPSNTKYIPTKTHKENISKAKKGKCPELTESYITSIRKAKLGSRNPNFGKKAKRVICEYCAKNVANNIYIQYHGIKCKSLRSKVQ